MRTVVRLLICCLSIAYAIPAAAQINSPPPTLMGQPSYHIYSVPGVISSIGLGTYFSCTNVTGANIRVGVETFSGGGGPGTNDPSATSLDVQAGGTLIFGTTLAVGLSVNSNLGSGILGRGSARILATETKGIICTAFLADNGNAPPTSMADLKVVKKTKQKGD